MGIEMIIKDRNLDCDYLKRDYLHSLSVKIRKYSNGIGYKRWKIMSWDFLCTEKRLNLDSVIPELKEKNVYDIWLKLLMNILAANNIINPKMFLDYEEIIHDSLWSEDIKNKMKRESERLKISKD